jgi:hypothetical protein
MKQVQTRRHSAASGTPHIQVKETASEGLFSGTETENCS